MYHSFIPEVVIVSRTLLWQARKKMIGTAAMINVTAADAPALAVPPAAIC